MLMLSFIPAEWITYAIHGIFGIGVIGMIIGTLGSKLLFVSSYGHVVKSIAGLFFVIGLFLEGYNFASQDWIEQAKKFEEKVKIAEQQAKDANDKLSKEVADKNKTIAENQKLLQEKLKLSSQKIDAECKVAPEAVQILNEALRLRK
jgi:hypothetical protein